MTTAAGTTGPPASDPLTVDVVVLGAGPAGETAAGRCAEGGLDVALVERELVGGECSYWGCIPSKTLLRPGDALAAARRAPGAAEAVVGPPDAKAAFAQRDLMTSGWDDAGQLGWLADRGIRLLRGVGRLSGERAVAVRGDDGAERAVHARQAVVLAVGTRAVVPPVPGLRELPPWDNRGATAAEQVPARLLVLGGGAVGAELAQGFRRLGSEQVTVVEGAERLLAREEPFAGEEVRAAFEAEGIAVRTGRLLAQVRQGADAVTATLDDGTEVDCDRVLAAVGRRPALHDAGLPAVGLPADRPVDVDDELRAVGVPGGWLFAVGDCNGLAPLTHMGKYQARVAADVVLGRGARDRASRTVVPRVTFTDPQVCAVGLTEHQAREQGRRVRAVTAPVGGVPGAYVLGNGVGGTGCLVVDPDSRVLLGATFTGPGLQELLHSATVAVAAGVTVDELWHAVPAFPTVSEIWLHLLTAYGL